MREEQERICNVNQRREKGVWIGIVMVYLLTALYIVAHHLGQGNRLMALFGPVSLLFLLIPSLAQRLFRQRLGFVFQVFVLVFCYCAFSLGVGLRWYEASGVYDKVMHGISGVLFFGVGFYVYAACCQGAPYRLTERWVLQMTYAFFFSLAVAVLWEVYEFMGFVLIGHDAQHHLQTGVFDTMLDMIACLLGSAVYAACYALYAKKGISSVFIRLLRAVTPAEKDRTTGR